MERYISLSNFFTLKGSMSQKILYDLRHGSNYELTTSQYHFLSLLNGELSLTGIMRRYDQASGKIIKDFIKNLSTIEALDLNKEKVIRHIQTNIVPDRRLESVHLEASAECNMDCVHCYQSKYRKAGMELRFEEIIPLLDQMSGMQVSNVGISGGEPLMIPNLFRIMRAIEERDMRISALFTNGLLVNENVIQEIKSMRSKFGIFVSLDSISEQGMSFRGYSDKEAKGVIEIILQNIKKLVSEGFNVVINTVVNSVNINELQEMYSIIRELNVDSWRIGFPKPTPNFKKYLNKFGLEWDTIANECFILLERHFKNKMPFHMQVEYLFREELFKDGSLDLLSDDDYVCDYEGRRSECCIKPNGDVVSCAYCSDLPVGNIKRSSLSDIWSSSDMNKTKMIRIRDVVECRDCDIKSLCGTGCRANAFFLHSNFQNAKDDYACNAVKFFNEKMVPLLKKFNFI